MAQKIGSIYFDVIANTTQVNLTIDKTISKFEKMADKAKKVGRDLESAGRTMTAAITLPAVAIGTVATKSFADFDSAMNQSLAIMGEVNKTLKTDMSNAAKKVAEETTFAAKEAAAGYFFLASAGLNAEQSLAALPITAKFAQAGMFDLSTAVDLLTDAQSALGMKSRDAGKNLENMTAISDSLVKANTLANASVSQFAMSLTREAGAAMKNFRIEMNSGIAVLAAYADQGIKGELAGTTFGRAIRLMTKAAIDNEEAWDKAGVAVFNEQGNLRNMADIVEDLTNSFGSMTTKQRTMSLETLGLAARQQQAILPLLGMANAIRGYESQLEKAGGTTEAIANKQMKSFSSRLKLVKNNVNLLMVEIGERLAPTLLKVGIFVDNLTSSFRKLSGAQKDQIIKWVALAAAIGPVLIVVGKLIAITAAVVTSPLLPWVLAVGVGVWVLIEAFTQLGEAIVGVDKNSQNMDMSWAERLSSMIDTMTSFVTHIKFALRLIFKVGQAVFRELALKWVDRINEMGNAFSAFKNLFTKEGFGMGDFLSQIWEGVPDTRDGFVEAIKNAAIDNQKELNAELERNLGVNLTAATKAEKASFLEELRRGRGAGEITGGFDPAAAMAAAEAAGQAMVGAVNAEVAKDKNAQGVGKPVEVIGDTGLTKQFASAVEAGSVEAYRLRKNAQNPQGIVQQQQLEVQKMTQKEVKEMAQDSKKTAEATAVMARTLASISVGDVN